MGQETVAVVVLEDSEEDSEIYEELTSDTTVPDAPEPTPREWKFEFYKKTIYFFVEPNVFDKLDMSLKDRFVQFHIFNSQKLKR